MLSTANSIPFTSKYIKVVVSAGGSGGLPGALIPMTTNMISSTINVTANSTHLIREYVQTDSNNQSNTTHGATGTMTVLANNYQLVRVGGTNFPSIDAVLFNIPKEARYLRYRVKMTNGKLIYSDYRPGNYINDGFYRDTSEHAYNQTQVSVGMSDFSFVVHRELTALKANHAYSNSYGSGSDPNADISFGYWDYPNTVSNQFLFESYNSSMSGSLQTFKFEGYYL